MALIKAGLLDPLIKGKEPKSAQELASLTGVEELLIGKLDYIHHHLIERILTLNSSPDEAINRRRNSQGDEAASLCLHPSL